MNYLIGGTVDGSTSTPNQSYRHRLEAKHVCTMSLPPPTPQQNFLDEVAKLQTVHPDDHDGIYSIDFDVIESACI